jgi:hypothetical protein
MWDAINKFLLSQVIHKDPDTMAHRYSQFIIDYVFEPILEIAYALKLTKYKPVSKFTADDLDI